MTPWSSTAGLTRSGPMALKLNRQLSRMFIFSPHQTRTRSSAGLPPPPSAPPSAMRFSAWLRRRQRRPFTTCIHKGIYTGGVLLSKISRPRLYMKCMYAYIYIGSRTFSQTNTVWYYLCPWHCCPARANLARALRHRLHRGHYIVHT